MADTLFTRGIPEWGDSFTGGTVKALLLKGDGYVPNVDHDFVADVNPGANELTGAGYARETLTGKAETLVDASDRVMYDADNPDFGAIAAGETVTGMVVYLEVTNDADSILLGYYELTPTPTNGTSFLVTLSADGLAYFRQAAA